MSDRAERRTHFLRAFAASVLGTGLSRVLGALRDVVIAGWLGAGASSDAFLIAFTVPNVFRRFVADEGLTGALIPAMSQAEAEGGPHQMRRLANTVLSALLIANLALCVLGVWFAEPLVLAFAYAYKDDPTQLALTVSLTRWMFPFLGMVSLVSFFEGLLNHKDHFFVPKLAPGLVSASMAACLVLLGTHFQEPAFALALGVLIGGTAHVLVNVPMIRSVWGPLGLCWDFASPRFRHVAGELSKVVAIGLFAQVNIFILRQLAASLDYGAVTWYWNANRVVDLAQGMIAVAIGSALLPNISRAVAEQSWERFREDLVGALRLAAFLLLPAAVVLVVFATPIVSVLFRHGMYGWEDVQQTVLTLQFMVPFLLAVAGMNILKKVYFALDDRGTLIRVGALGVLLTGGLGYALVGSLGVAGLGLALSVATTTQLILYVLLLRRRIGVHLGLDQLARPMGRMLLASIPPAVLLLGVNAMGHWPDGPSRPGNLLLLLVGGSAAAVAYIGSAHLLHIDEARLVTERLRARFRSH